MSIKLGTTRNLEMYLPRGPKEGIVGGEGGLGAADTCPIKSQESSFTRVKKKSSIHFI